MAQARPFLDRFWEKVDVQGEDDCWEWQASFATTGYGQIMKSPGKLVRAHRVSCELAHGESELHALHTCDNRKCCNPTHLYWGTNQRNMHDARDRNRAGSKQKLTAEQAAEIRSSTEPVNVLATRYGISRWQVTNIRSGRQWAPLKTQ